MISPNTINLCLELLATVSVPVTAPDAEAKMSALVAAHQELLALSNGDGGDQAPARLAAM
jgi:hypothetical protein